jgi:hypothetical protein
LDEEEVSAVDGTPAEPEPEVVQQEEPAQEEAAQPESTEDWTTDPAIAGASSAQPDWAQSAAVQSPPAREPEPVTTYTGPPGFNNLPSKSAQPPAPIAPASAVPSSVAVPITQRTNSRAANRFKNAEGQGVVLPPTLDRGTSSMEMQFGSLSFGGLNGDGVEAPLAPVSPQETKQEFQQPPPSTQQQQITSPIRQPAQTSQPTQQSPYQSYQAPGQAQQPPSAGYPTNQQTLQAQMSAYQSQYVQQQQHQQAAQPQAEQHQTQPQQGYAGFRGFEQYGSLPQPTQQQLQPQQEQAAPPTSQSPYDAFGAAPAGAAGGFGGSHLFGQGQQVQQHQGQEYSQRVSKRATT